MNLLTALIIFRVAVSLESLELADRTFLLLFSAFMFVEGGWMLKRMRSARKGERRVLAHPPTEISAVGDSNGGGKADDDGAHEDSR